MPSFVFFVFLFVFFVIVGRARHGMPVASADAAGTMVV